MRLSFIFVEPSVQVAVFHLSSRKLSVIKTVAAIPLGLEVEEPDIPEPGRTDIIWSFINHLLLGVVHFYLR